MNGKIIAAIVAVLVVVVAAVGIVALVNQNPVEVGVVYDGNGGDWNGDKTYLRTSNVVEDNYFSSKDHAFRVWNTSADGSGTSYKPGDRINYPDNGNVTLYAIWGYSFYVSQISGSTSGHAITVPSIHYYLVDGESYTEMDEYKKYALPDDGAAALMFSVSGFTWTYDEAAGTFVGSTENSTLSVKITLTGTDSIEYKADAEDGGSLIFTYSGPVDCKISVNYKS